MQGGKEGGKGEVVLTSERRMAFRLNEKEFNSSLAALDTSPNSLSPIFLTYRIEIIMAFFRDVMRIINNISKGGQVSL